MKNKFVYMVVCLDDFGLVQATRKVWENESDAEKYRQTVAPSRNPQLVQAFAPSCLRTIGATQGNEPTDSLHNGGSESRD
jgi:hypothetical protein